VVVLFSLAGWLVACGADDGHRRVPGEDAASPDAGSGGKGSGGARSGSGGTSANSGGARASEAGIADSGSTNTGGAGGHAPSDASLDGGGPDANAPDAASRDASLADAGADVTCPDGGFTHGDGALDFPQATRWLASTGGNDHYYAVVSAPAGVSWSSANRSAVAAGGYLATITSQQENDIVASIIDDPAYWNAELNTGNSLGPWIGGRQEPNETTPSAGWTWVTGEPFVYTNWNAGEPNDALGANEDFLHYFCTGSCRGNHWNDLPSDISVYGSHVVAFVIEYDADPSLRAACFR
jgi:hypothetical protein